jgi:predicted peroxiredoxin
MTTTATTTTSPDSKVLICLNHGAEDHESVLIAYLVGVESLRAGKQAVIFLTKDAIHLATPGFADTIVVPNAPSVAELHEEYLANGGRFIACPVCVRVRGMQDAEWVAGTQVAGVPAVLAYTTGGALVFNY